MEVVLEWSAVPDSNNKNDLVKWICPKESYDPKITEVILFVSGIEVWVKQNYFSDLPEGLNFI